MLQVTDILRSALDFQSGRKEAPDIQTDSGRYEERPAPVVVWNVTNHCNMACPHCYSSAKLKKEPGEFTTEQARFVIDRLAEYGVRILIVSGGEPLLREDLFVLLEYARDKGIQTHLSSNGVLLTGEKARRLKELGVAYVGVSLDGLPLFNNPYRRLDNAYGLALAGLRNARKEGLDTGIRITLSRKNEDQLFPLMEVAEQEGIPRFYLSHLVYGGRGAGYAMHDVLADENRRMMRMVFERALKGLEEGSSLRIVSGGNDADGVFLYLFIEEMFGKDIAHPIAEVLRKRGGNSAGEKIINIDHLGLVHPDQFWRTLDCGNILENDLNEIMNSELMLRLRDRQTYLKGRCRSCRFSDLCRGSHRERAFAVTGDMWEADPACYLKEYELKKEKAGVA